MSDYALGFLEENMASGLYERIYETVKLVPAGRVATYGQIAALVGIPNGARQVGYALASLGRGRPRPDVPWHRVVNAKGESRIGKEQVSRLAAEGIRFDPSGRIDLGEFGWDGL